MQVISRAYSRRCISSIPYLPGVLAEWTNRNTTLFRVVYFWESHGGLVIYKEPDHVALTPFRGSRGEGSADT